MSKIVAVHHEEGSITSYRLDDGRMIDKHEAVRMADAGELPGISSFETRDGGYAVRSDRGQPDYALDSLPEF